MAKISLEKNDKSLFAAYLNMAVNNVCIVLDDIAQKLELKSNKKKIITTNSDVCSECQYLQDSYITQMSVDKQEALKARLLNHFPFLKAILSRFQFHNEDRKSYKTHGRVVDKKDVDILDNNDITTVVKKLRQTLIVLTHYRNLSSHFLNNESNDDDTAIKEMAYDLDRIFLVSGITIKERYGLGNELAFVNDDRVVKKTSKYRDKKGRPKVKVKSVTPNYDSPHCFFTKDFFMSKGALVLLASLFIEKKYSTIMFAHLTDFYKVAKTESARRLLREIYTCNTIRLPKRDLSTSYDTTILGLDMLNEISKCPKELYETLSNEDKKRFDTETADVIEGLEDALLKKLSTEQKADYYDEHNNCFKDKQALYNNVSDEIKTDFFTTQNGIMRRFDDRFPELAMRWFDQTEKLGKLRFQVIYGKYHEIFYKCNPEGKKHCADGIDRERWIERKLIAYGRIQDIEKKRNDENWKGFAILKKANEDGTLSESGLDPWITDFTPQYMIDRNNIGLKITDGKPDEMDFESPNTQPDFWMSVYDLPGMAFYQYLLDNHKDIAGNKSIESVITSFKFKIQKLFSDLKDGKLTTSKNQPYGRPLAKSFAEEYGGNYKIDWKDVPGKIKDYIYPLENRATTDNDGNLYENKPRTTFEDYVKSVIKKEIKKTAALMRKYEKLKKAPDKRDKDAKNAKVLRLGDLGSFLAEDIVYLLEYRDAKHPGNVLPDTPTGINYDAMQKQLATFSNERKFGLIKSMFQNLHIIGKQTSTDKVALRHPFLGQLLNKRQYGNVIDLYGDYLTEREYYFNTLWNKVELQLESKLPLKQLMFHQFKKKWGEKNEAYYQALGGRYMIYEHNKKSMPQPFMLPNGIFADEIRKIMIKLLESNGVDVENNAMKLLSDDSKPANVTIMVEIYHKYIATDKPQEFYKFNRTYDLFTELNKGAKKADNPELSYSYDETKAKFNRPKFSELKEYIDNYYNCKIKEEYHNPEREKQNKDYFKKLFNEYQLNERALNRISVQDMILFYLSQGLTQLDSDQHKLEKVKPNATDGILTKSVPVEINLEQSGCSIRWNSIKVKEITRIYKLLRDGRLKKLLAIYVKEQGVEKPFDSAKIERELEMFDLNRCKIFESIFKLEDKAKDIPEIEDEFRKKQFVDFKFIIDDVLREKYPSMEVELNAMHEIRNCFAHNDYVQIDKYSIIDGIEGESVAERMLTAFNNAMEKVIAII